MNNLNKLSALNKNSNDYKKYEELEKKMKDLKCGNLHEIEYINEYLYSLEIYRFFEWNPDEHGAQIVHTDQSLTPMRQEIATVLNRYFLAAKKAQYPTRTDLYPFSISIGQLSLTM